MNQRTRAVGIAILVGSATAVLGQRFYLADMSGNEITGRIKLALDPRATNRLQIWVENGSTTTYSHGMIFAGFDRVTSDANTTFNASAATAGYSRKILVKRPFSNYARNIDGAKSDGTYEGPVDLTGNPFGEYKYCGSSMRTNVTQERSLGLSWAWAPHRAGYSETTYFIKLAAGARLRLADLDLANLSMQVGEVFGDDPGENGLTLNMDAQKSQASCYMAWKYDHFYAPGTVKYIVEAVVPEPGTMLAIAAGLAGLAARRRRK